MKSSEKFSPKTILLWQKVAEHPEAQRILSLFPSAEVHVIKQQRYSPNPNMSAGLGQMSVAGHIIN
jgi:hypothetical protein